MKPRTHYRVETWSPGPGSIKGWWLWSLPRTIVSARKAEQAAMRRWKRVRIVEVRERLVPVAGRGRR